MYEAYNSLISRSHPTISVPAKDKAKHAKIIKDIEELGGKKHTYYYPIYIFPDRSMIVDFKDEFKAFPPPENQ